MISKEKLASLQYPDPRVTKKDNHNLQGTILVT